MHKGAKVKCLTCGDILQSTYRHDFKACTCHRGSSAKVERCAVMLRDELGLDENQYHMARCYINEEFGTGITVDGGEDYLAMSYSKAGHGYTIIEE